MDAKSVEEFQEQIGIKFHEPSRLWNAFIHSSYANERRNFVHIAYSSTMVAFDLSDFETEELIRMINDGRYKGEFKPNING